MRNAYSEDAERLFRGRTLELRGFCVARSQLFPEIADLLQDRLFRSAQFDVCVVGKYFQRDPIKRSRHFFTSQLLLAECVPTPSNYLHWKPNRRISFVHPLNEILILAVRFLESLQ